MTEKEPQRQKDVGQIIRYLSSTFNQAISPLERAQRTKEKGANRAYLMTRDFAYLLNEVALCPPCVLQRNITLCNEYIDQVMQEVQASRQG